MTRVCVECGFDATRWSHGDVTRTLAHVEDLAGFVLDGAGDDVIAEVAALPLALDGDPVDAVHSVMHRLHDAATIRREADHFDPMVGRVESLQSSRGGVPKASIALAEIGPSGVLGDVQGNRRHHGRPWQAVCLYSSELLAALRREGHPISPGAIGENLTISGVDWSRMRGGLTISIAEVALRTSSPVAPCTKIGGSFHDGDWKRIDHTRRPGWARWYASVRIGGIVQPGDTVTVTA